MIERLFRLHRTRAVVVFRALCANAEAVNSWRHVDAFARDVASTDDTVDDDEWVDVDARDDGRELNSDGEKLYVMDGDANASVGARRATVLRARMDDGERTMGDDDGDISTTKMEMEMKTEHTLATKKVFIKHACACEDVDAEEAARAAFASAQKDGYGRVEASARAFRASSAWRIAKVFGARARLRNCAIWFGRDGYVTPLHYDVCHGFLIQAVGTKTFTLFHPDDFRKLYRREDRPEISRVDLDDVDLDAFPDFADATPMTVTLQPGDVLYTPPFFWHHVRSSALVVGEPVISFLVPFDIDDKIDTKHISYYV